MLGLTKIWSHSGEVKIEAKGEGGIMKILSRDKKEMGEVINKSGKGIQTQLEASLSNYKVLTARKTAQFWYWANANARKQGLLVNLALSKGAKGLKVCNAP